MYNNILLLLFCCCYLGCNNATNHESILTSDSLILAFGDSLTYGTGANKGEDYPSILASLTNIKVINAGVPGETSNQGLQRLPALLDQYQPDLLILIHGGNDILKKLSRSDLKNNLLAMFEEAKARNIQIISFGVPEPGLFLKSADIYQQLKKGTQVPMELTLLPRIIGDKSLKSDIVHPNAKGYQKMAEGILAFLQENNIVKR